jgi:hypothetical protein
VSMAGTASTAARSTSHSGSTSSMPCVMTGPRMPPPQQQQQQRYQQQPRMVSRFPRDLPPMASPCRGYFRPLMPPSPASAGFGDAAAAAAGPHDRPLTVAVYKPCAPRGSRHPPLPANSTRQPGQLQEWGNSGVPMYVREWDFGGKEGGCRQPCGLS